MQGKSTPAIALCDTGAQAKLLTSLRLAKQVYKAGSYTKPLQILMKLQDYQGKYTETVDKRVKATLIIDGKSFEDQKLKIVNTGYDLFIGLDWLSSQGVLLDCKNKELL